jgi:hypothetical protein
MLPLPHGNTDIYTSIFALKTRAEPPPTPTIEKWL